MSIVTVSEIQLPPFGWMTQLTSRLRELLQQGWQPRQLALALALGATIGLLPTVWGTSLLCLLCAAPLRLNQLAVQLANYLVYPLQLLLFLPYLKLGEALFSSHLLPADLANFWARLQASPGALLQLYWQANLQAILAWLLTAPLLLAASFLIFWMLAKCLHQPQPA